MAEETRERPLEHGPERWLCGWRASKTSGAAISSRAIVPPDITSRSDAGLPPWAPLSPRGEVADLKSRVRMPRMRSEGRAVASEVRAPKRVRWVVPYAGTERQDAARW